MDNQSAYRSALESGDVETLRRLWAHSHAHLPQPKNAKEAEIMMHLSRCGADSISMKARAYSHRWLVDHNLPSTLPDELLPECERMFPRISDSVGISFRASNSAFSEVAAYAQKKASDAVAEMWADGDKDSDLVRKRILEIKKKSEREMLGAFTLKTANR